MRSLQIRLPALVVVVLAVSLAIAAFAVFETLLITGQDRLDGRLEGEALRVREFVALNSPGALPGTGAAPPASADLLEVMERYLRSEGARSDDHMTVITVGERTLSTPDAPGMLEVLRDRGAIDSLASGEFGELTTTDTTEGEVRTLALDLVVADDADAQATVLGPREEIRRRAYVALGRVGATAAVGLLIGGLLLAVIIRRSLRPLTELADAARRAELEHLGGRVELGERTDEIGELAREFNRMLDRLEASVAGQREFMASISHELRTPIAIARGHLDVLASSGSEVSRELIEETADLVRDELLRMHRLVVDLLALGRADDDDFVVRAPVKLRDFFDELQLRSVGLGARRVRFEPVDDCTVEIDADRVAQAVLNLIVNSVTHAVDRSETVVSADTEGGWLKVTVGDDGHGFDSSLRGREFEPFVRADGTRGAAGLGLAVVKAVADAHGGWVAIETGSESTQVIVAVPAA